MLYAVAEWLCVRGTRKEDRDEKKMEIEVSEMYKTNTEPLQPNTSSQ